MPIDSDRGYRDSVRESRDAANRADREQADRNSRPDADVGLPGYGRRDSVLSSGFGYGARQRAAARREGLTTSDDGPGRRGQPHNMRGHMGFGDAVQTALLDRFLEPVTPMGLAGTALKAVVPGGTLASILGFGVDVAGLMGAKSSPPTTRKGVEGPRPNEPTTTAARGIGIQPIEPISPPSLNSNAPEYVLINGSYVRNPNRYT